MQRDGTTEIPLDRRLGLFDATMIVMGGIIGSGIFINPYIVARELERSWLVLLAWLFGGGVVLVGALLYAELAARLPEVGGQYAYLRVAWHPAIAFLYGWTLLLVIQSGGMAAVGITFARYFIELTGVGWSDWGVAVVTLLILTFVNCLGVRAGSTTQNTLMVMKIGAVVALVVAGFALSGESRLLTATAGTPSDRPVMLAFGAAMIPVMFSYGGWQTASFVSAEMKNPRRDLARGVVIGVVGVVLVYMSVNLVALHVLGVDGLAASTTPASAVMRAVLGEPGARFIAVGIAISTLGFLSQSMLTAPRVYYAMAKDGLFFRSVATVHRRTHAPIMAIALQGLLATVIAMSGTYEKILSYVVSADFAFFGLTALSLIPLRRMERSERSEPGFRAPFHPWSTLFFAGVSWIVVVATFWQSPFESLIGFAIIASGLPVYYAWRGRDSH